MLVDIAPTTTPDGVAALPHDGDPPPDALGPLPLASPAPGPRPVAGALPTRRKLLGLLATAGATAAAAHLSGRLADELAAGPSRLDPARALRITVLGLTTGADHAAGAAAHGGHDAPPDLPEDTTPDTLGARVWSRLVTVDLVIRNTAAADVLFSPGQVRLRLPDGTSVMPVESERRVGALTGRTTIRTWVRFLAPQDEAALSVDYLPAGATTAVRLEVGEGDGHGAAR